MYGLLKVRNLTFGHLVPYRSKTVAHLGQVLPGNTLISFYSYIRQNSRLFVKVKIVLWVHKDPTLTFFTYFAL